MIRRFIASASLACGIVWSGCSSGGDGGPVTFAVPSASEPGSTPSEATGGVDPSPGTEPAGTTSVEPPGGSLDPTPGNTSVATIEQLCARACAHIQSSCPGVDVGSDCAGNCADTAAQFPTCAMQFRNVVTCLSLAPLRCLMNDIDTDACGGANEAFSNCLNTIINTGGAV